VRVACKIDVAVVVEIRHNRGPLEALSATSFCEAPGVFERCISVGDTCVGLFAKIQSCRAFFVLGADDEVETPVGVEIVEKGSTFSTGGPAPVVALVKYGRGNVGERVLRRSLRPTDHRESD
jgi:hypothetical protein